MSFFLRSSVCDAISDSTAEGARTRHQTGKAWRINDVIFACEYRVVCCSWCVVIIADFRRRPSARAATAVSSRRRQRTGWWHHQLHPITCSFFGCARYCMRRRNHSEVDLDLAWCCHQSTSVAPAQRVWSSFHEQCLLTLPRTSGLFHPLLSCVSVGLRASVFHHRQRWRHFETFIRKVGIEQCADVRRLATFRRRISKDLRIQNQVDVTHGRGINYFDWLNLWEHVWMKAFDWFSGRRSNRKEVKIFDIRTGLSFEKSPSCSTLTSRNIWQKIRFDYLSPTTHCCDVYSCSAHLKRTACPNYVSILHKYIESFVAVLDKLGMQSLDKT